MPFIFAQLDINGSNSAILASLLISFLAFVISGLTLYFNSLKDAEITLANEPIFSMVQLTSGRFSKGPPEVREYRPYLETAIRFRTQFVLVNKGARAGTVSVKINLKPTTKLQHFFSGYSAFRIVATEYDERTNWQELEEEFFLIQPRSEFLIDVLTIMSLCNWNYEIRLDQKSSEDWCEELNKVESRNLELLKNFCSVLSQNVSTEKEEMYLATAEPTITASVRHKLRHRLKFWLKPSHRSVDLQTVIPKIHVGRVTEEFIKHYSFGLENWNRTRPHIILDSFDSISTVIWQLTTKLDNYSRNLDSKTVVALRGYDRDDLLEFWNELTGRSSHIKTIIGFIFNKTGLYGKLQKLNSDLIKFKLVLNTADAETPLAANESLDDSRKRLKSEVGAVSQDLEKLRKDLKICEQKASEIHLRRYDKDEVLDPPVV
jgi:hypothetical protein